MDALERILTAKRVDDDGERMLADLIADVAAAGGVALVDDLIEAGYPRAVIAAALEPTAADKRTRPWLRCASINGLDIVWATTKAWSQAGQPNRREAPPGSRTARHRTAPAAYPSTRTQSSIGDTPVPLYRWQQWSERECSGAHLRCSQLGQESK